jgi:Holliday junction resolvase
MGPERRYQTQLIAELRKRGAWVAKYPAGPHGTIGTPDLLACYRGYFLAIECKARREEPTTMQQRQLDLIREAGGIAIVAWPGLDLDHLLDAFDADHDDAGGSIRISYASDAAALLDSVGADPAS